MKRPLSAVALTGLLLGALAPALQAQTTYVWSNLVNGNASGSWGTAAAWTPAGPAAGADNTAQFTLPVTNATTPGTITLDGNRTIGNLYFGNTSASNLSYTVNAGTPSSSALTLSVFSGVPTVAVTNRAVTVNTPISSPQGLTKAGAGTLALGAANVFGGTLSNQAGFVQLNNANALAGLTNVVVNSGGNVTLSAGNVTYANVPATLAGSGASSQGALFLSGNSPNAIWPGPITLNGATTIGNYGASGTLTLPNVISGTGGLTFYAGGGATSHVLTVNLNTNETYSGGTTLNATFGSSEVVNLNGGANTLPTTTAMTINDNWNANYLTLDLKGNNQTMTSLTVNGGAAATANLTSSAGKPTLTLTSTGAGVLALNGGTINLSGLNLSVSGSADNSTVFGGGSTATTVNITNTTINSSFYTDVGRTAPTVVNLNNGTVLNNTGEILMGYGNSSGVGTLNINTGAVVNAHFLRVGNNALATNNLNAGGKLVVDQIYDNYGITNNSSTFNFNGGLLQVGAGGEAWFQSSIDNALIQNGGALIDTAGKYATINAPLRPGAGSTGGLVKLGAGTLRLADSWTYTGTSIDTNTVPQTTNTFPVTVLITNTYVGGTIVSNGMLIIDGALPSSAVLVTTPVSGGTNALLGTGTVATATVSLGAALNPGRVGAAGTINVGSLTNSAGSFLVADLADPTQIGNGVNDLLAVNTLAAANPTYVSFNPLYGSATPGRYVVATYNNLSGVPGNFVLDPLLVGSRFGAAVDATSTLGQIAIVITNGSAPNGSLTWYGNSANNNWDVAATPNWAYGSDYFYNLDGVSFDDSSLTQSVNLVSALYPTTVTFNNYSYPYTLAGPGKVSGPAALVLNGTANVVIGTDNNNTGTTTLNGSGTLQIGNGSTHGAIGSGDIQFAGYGNTLAYNRADALTLSNRLHGSSSATPNIQVNSGTLMLAGSADNAYAVATVASNATLVLAKASSSSVHALGGGGTALTINAGGTARLGGSGGDQIVSGRDVQNDGTLDLAGQSETINNLMGTGVVTSSTAGNATLGVGSASPTVAFNGVVQNGAGTVGLTAVGGSLVLTTTNTATGPLTLTGGGVILSNTTGQAWAGPVTITNNSGVNPRLILQASEQIGDTSVMSFGGTGGERRFQLNGFNETLGGFNDLAGVSGNRIVEAATDGQDNSPATLTLNVPAGVTNSMNGYVRDAASTTNSRLTLIKTGAGAQVFGGSAPLVGYSGPTTIANGVLQLSGGSVLANSAVTLAGGTLNISGGGTRTTPIAGNGTLQVGGNTFITTATNTYTGTTLISAGTFQVGDGSVNGSILTDVTNNGVFTIKVATNTVQSYAGVISGTGSFTKDAFGTLYLNGVNSFSGNATVQAGALWINNSLGLGTGAKTVALSNGSAGHPELHLNGTNGNINLPSTLSLSTSWAGTPVIQNEAGDNVIAGNLSLTSGGGATYVAVNGGTLTLSGGISPAAAGREFQLGGAGNGTVSGVISNGAANVLNVLRKLDAGTWTLSGNNSFSGPTTVEAGTLLVNGSLYTNSVTVSNNAVLGGSGLIQGPVMVQATATLSPGSSIGTLTVSNNLTLAGSLVIEINKALAQTNDMVVVSGTLVNMGTGTLTVTNEGPALATGDRFKVFNQPLAGGDALTIVSGATNVVWTNNLAVDGTIAVVSAPAGVSTSAPQVTSTYANKTLTLAWPADHLGWVVQSNSVGVNKTNWYDIPGSGTVSNLSFTVDPAKNNVFFRLRYPAMP